MNIPTSKTRLAECVRELRSNEILAGLEAKPELLAYRDERGRNWLHLCASIDTRKKKGLRQVDAIPLAKGLLSLGIDVNEPAFTEGTWHATPLWYAVGRGRNHALARFLLASGSTPEHCLWAACFNEDLGMLQILVDARAYLEAVAENETPLLGAVKSSKFKAARFLLEAGSDPDFVDVRGMTALHYMLKKSSDARHFKMFVQHGARGDIPGPDGRTAAEILGRKRDSAFHKIADHLK